MSSFVVGVVTGAFCGHPERREIFARLIRQLHVEGEFFGSQIVIEKDPGECHEWSWRVWTRTYRLAQTWRASHCVFLNDDVILGPHFRENLHALAAFDPEGIWSLRDFHPHARRAYEGGARVLATDDAINGNAYMIPTKLMPEMFRFFEEDLKPEAFAWPRGEDTKIGFWAMCQGRPCLQPMPALTDHDMSIPSSYGQDDHKFRRPMILPQDSTWLPGPIADVGPTYSGLLWWLRTWLTPRAARKYQVIDLVYAAAKRAEAVQAAGCDEETTLR